MITDRERNKIINEAWGFIMTAVDMHPRPFYMPDNPEAREALCNTAGGFDRLLEMGKFELSQTGVRFALELNQILLSKTRSEVKTLKYDFAKFQNLNDQADILQKELDRQHDNLTVACPDKHSLKRCLKLFIDEDGLNIQAINKKNRTCVTIVLDVDSARRIAEYMTKWADFQESEK